MENNKNVLFVVVPCFNEEEVLPETSKQLKEKLNELMRNSLISTKSKVVFVNDGSKDKTWEIIENLHKEDPIFRGIKLSRNRGHQNALLAGLMTVKDEADMLVTIDADLQDDIGVLDQFVQKYNEGCDIVYGVRSSRKKDSFFKRNTARFFYRFMKIMGVETISDHADYRLMSKRALNALEEFKEVNLFLRGIVPLIGFKSDKVYYERNERFAGKSKYPLSKMISFAVTGITSFSIRPIKMITWLGFLVFLVSLGALIYTIVGYFMGGTSIGWASVIVSVWAIGGLILLSIGIVGEYIGKIYMETKNRPKYIIEDYLNNEEKKDD